MSLQPFQPDPATADAILQSIAADYSLSLTDIAAQHQTTIEALTAWLTREDIDERLTAIESACARRARLTATNHLPAVAHVAKQALEEASDVLRLPPDYRTQHSIALRIRATESARKAAALLLRIANFTPGPHRQRHHDAPMSPRVTPLFATSTATPTESSQGVPTSATPADRAQSAPCVGQLSETTTPCVAAPQAPIAATPTASAPTTSPSAPPTDRAQPAPTSVPTTERALAAPNSATSQACSASARHAAIPRQVQYSAAISDCLTLISASADSAPLWPPSPTTHPPPTPQLAHSPLAHPSLLPSPLRGDA